MVEDLELDTSAGLSLSFSLSYTLPASGGDGWARRWRRCLQKPCQLSGAVTPMVFSAPFDSRLHMCHGVFPGCFFCFLGLVLGLGNLSPWPGPGGALCVRGTRMPRGRGHSSEGVLVCRGSFRCLPSGACWTLFFCGAPPLPSPRTVKTTDIKPGATFMRSSMKIHWVWLEMKQEGQTAGFGPWFHLPGFWYPGAKAEVSS